MILYRKIVPIITNAFWLAWLSWVLAETSYFVSELRAGCPQWQTGLPHLCRMLTGADTAWAAGAVTRSCMIAAAIVGIWLVFRLPQWLLGPGRHVSVSGVAAGAAAAGRAP
jgi:hypothetical protein|nr:hypothetical protein [uncultured Rhodopila sp.]